MSDKPKVINVPASGFQYLEFSNYGQPWAAVQLYRSGSADLSYSIQTSNYSQEEVGGLGMYKNPVSGSDAHWYREVGLSGSAFSSGGGAGSFMVQLANVSSRFLQVALTSSNGGQFEVFCWTKRA